MIYLLVGALILLFAGFVLYQIGKRPRRHRITAQEDLSRFFEVLFYRGYDGGFMIIETPRKEDFIQFSKYLGGRKKVGLQFDFPFAAWSVPYYEPLKNLLEREGFAYTTQQAAAKVGSGVSEFVVVDLKQNLERAAQLVKLALLEVFKLNPQERLTLYFVNVSPKEEKIGF